MATSNAGAAIWARIRAAIIYNYEFYDAKYIMEA